ncbi:hypothetical protein NDU88_006573 [Pleurodeles waltl]|uniref:Uncharacterized protein n=1 Tax=Pleurodeles waltl TaxID=8319 RepID=A0AAV7UMJ0_PLEWA|nr:hypothetical protein NDU88_006573 [Pleurodeles waltl]
MPPARIYRRPSSSAMATRRLLSPRAAPAPARLLMHRHAPQAAQPVLSKLCSSALHVAAIRLPLNGWSDHCIGAPPRSSINLCPPSFPAKPRPVSLYIHN